MDQQASCPSEEMRHPMCRASRVSSLNAELLVSLDINAAAFVHQMQLVALGRDGPHLRGIGGYTNP